jgi:hypothetical protein
VVVERLGEPFRGHAWFPGGQIAVAIRDQPSIGPRRCYVADRPALIVRLIDLQPAEDLRLDDSLPGARTVQFEPLPDLITVLDRVVIVSELLSGARDAFQHL